MDLENAKNNVAGQPLSSDAFDRLKQFIIIEDDGQEQKFVMPKYGKLLLAVTMCLGAVLTICTFVWGVL